MNRRILVADDDPAALALLQRILARGGFPQVYTTQDGAEVSRLFRLFGADMVVLDLHMGTVSGTEVIRRLRPLIPDGAYLPILVVSGDLTREARLGTLAAGATDFISKPFVAEEVLLRVRNHLHTRALHMAVEERKIALERKVAERTRELEVTTWEVLERLARAAELRDDDTGMHTRRVGDVSARIAAALGLPAEQVESIRRTAPLHDVGKIGVPDAVLLKPGKLDPDEWETMKRHTLVGADLLSAGRSEMVRLAEQIALAHHERWDGGGYPHGTAGEEIPLAARIVALADVFDALSSDRPYRPAWARARVLDEIAKCRGAHFDPGVVDAFLREVVPALP